MNNELKIYISVFELMKDEDKFNGLLEDICKYFNDHYPKEPYFENQYILSLWKGIGNKNRQKQQNV